MKTLLTAILPLLLVLISPAQVFAASLSLSPASGNFNQGCNFSVNINLDTQGANTDGTDAIVFYDPSLLSALSIVNGTIYPDYPSYIIDSQAGKITVSGLASVSQGFNGKGTLATINFQVQNNATPGPFTLKFDFDPNNLQKTTDSNVVERDTVVDVLKSVVNGNYTTAAGSCSGITPAGSPIGTTTSGSSFSSLNNNTQTSKTLTAGKGGLTSSTSGSLQTPVYNQLPTAGITTPTIVLAISATILTVLGIIGLALF